MFEKINKELEAFLARENDDSDETDNILNFLTTLSDSVQDKLDKLIEGDNNKKTVCQGVVENVCFTFKYTLSLTLQKELKE